jgi:hypothetical protein
MATKVVESHFKFSAKESVISTAQTLGKGTLTDPSLQSKSEEEHNTR